MNANLSKHGTSKEHAPISKQGVPDGAKRPDISLEALISLPTEVRSSIL